MSKVTLLEILPGMHPQPECRRAMSLGLTHGGARY